MRRHRSTCPTYATVPDAVRYLASACDGARRRDGHGFSAEHVARCSLIPNVVSQPADMIGQVDAVIIATDIGAEHVARARPFVDAGLPVFIDKPLVDNLSDLRVFQDWVAHGRPILSSSCMRYAKEFMPYQLSTAELGPLRFAGITSCGSLEAYGIHALEGIYPILGPGFLSARNIGARERNIIHLTHRSGVDAIVVVTSDMFGGFGCLELCGTVDSVSVKFADKFFSFKRQMEAFIDYLRTGVRPFAFEETAELMRLLVASIESREAGGREIRID